MGQFSWLDCMDNETQVVDNLVRDVFVLVPAEFGGQNIREHCYDGYGHFGGYDIYDLVADWNRKYLAEHPDFFVPHSEMKVSEFEWYPFYSNLSLSPAEITEKMIEKIGHFWEYRWLGIDISCYDEDNDALPYPIKITYNALATYELYDASLSDPNQGWKCYEYEGDDEDDEWSWEDDDDEYCKD